MNQISVVWYCWQFIATSLHGKQMLLIEYRLFYNKDPWWVILLSYSRKRQVHSLTRSLSSIDFFFPLLIITVVVVLVRISQYLTLFPDGILQKGVTQSEFGTFSLRNTAPSNPCFINVALRLGGIKWPEGQSGRKAVVHAEAKSKCQNVSPGTFTTILSFLADLSHFWLWLSPNL